MGSSHEPELRPCWEGSLLENPELTQNQSQWEHMTQKAQFPTLISE